MINSSHEPERDKDQSLCSFCKKCIELTLDRSLISSPAISFLIESCGLEPRGYLMTLISKGNPLLNQFLGTEGRYLIEATIDRNGVGQIYLAIDIHLNEPVVVKRLNIPVLNSSRVHRYFNQELELLVAFKSKYMARILDAGTDSEGVPFYVLEYLQGESLEQTLQREKPFPLLQALNIAQKICTAVDAIHQKILSRERSSITPQYLKPAHIFRVQTASSEHIKLLDYGLSQRIQQRIQNDDSDRSPPRSQEWMSESFHYMAPEQLNHGEAIDQRADIYRLGIILFELFSGTDPFDLKDNGLWVDEQSWVEAHRSTPPCLLQSLLGNDPLAEALSRIVDQCLQKQPHDRYPSVQALREALEQPLKNRTVFPVQYSSGHQVQSLTDTGDETVIQFVDSDPDKTILQSTDAAMDAPVNAVDRTQLQWVDASINSSTDDRTLAQYLDSSSYHPADQTMTQSVRATADPFQDQTFSQEQVRTPSPHRLAKSANLSQNSTSSLPQSKKTLTTRFSDLKGQVLHSLQRLTNRQQGRLPQPTPQNITAASPSQHPYSTYENPEVQSSQAQYQRVLRELDHCRLAFAKELGSNGKLRDAIAMAGKISETSRCFQDAQILIRSWKQL
jgi:serine/threonine protein kinase